MVRGGDAIPGVVPKKLFAENEQPGCRVSGGGS